MSNSELLEQLKSKIDEQIEICTKNGEVPKGGEFNLSKNQKAYKKAVEYYTGFKYVIERDKLSLDSDVRPTDIPLANDYKF